MYKVFNNFKWIYKNCKSQIPLLITIILIHCIISFLGVGNAFVTKFLIDCSLNNDKTLIIKWLVIFSLMLILQIVLTSINSVCNTYCSEKIRNDLQKGLFKHIIYSRWTDHNKYHSVELLTRITNDTGTIVNMICNIIPGIISLFFTLLSSFIGLLYISKFMSLAAIIIFPVLILLSKIYGRKLRKFYIKIQQKETIYNSFIQESFNNILILKSFCLEKRKLKFMKSIQKDKLNLSVKKSYFSCISNALLSLSSMIGYFLVFAWSAYMLPSGGSSVFGNLTAMIQLFENIQTPIYGLTASFPQLISAVAAADRLIEIEKMTLEDINKDLLFCNYIDMSTSNNLEIEFNNVSFSYNHQTNILDNISFSLSNHDIAAIIGPSGQGKTTIIRLLLSLIDADSGLIKINGEALNYKHRMLISYVPQGDTLFSGTILENLTLGNYNFKEETINKALKMSSSFDFVNSLENKINTVIGENGLGLSQGQAQRLSIARALLRKSPILILDEATSSLDADTELYILNQIKNLYYKPLCIIITHRPSALTICNKIYKLQDNHLLLQS